MYSVNLNILDDKINKYHLLFIGIRDDYSSVTTYTKVLRGFERITLEPGESRIVNFRLTPQDLALWDINNNFVVEPGTFSVMVGASSTDIRLTGGFEVVRN